MQVIARIMAYVALGIALAAPAAAEEYRVRYHVRIRPDAGIASVSIRVRQSTPLLFELSATLSGDHWFDFEADGDLEVVAGEKFRWVVPPGGGKLSYSARIDRLRDDEQYDSRCMPNWMLTRAEDFFPPMAARFETGAEADATLEFEVPPRWEVVTPFERMAVCQIISNGK